MKITDEYVEVIWPDGCIMPLPHLWLRDNCNCSDCKVPQTSEKKFLLTQVPADLKPSTVDLLDDELKITWPDGHISHYLDNDIRSLVNQKTDNWQPWDQSFIPEKTQYSDFLNDDLVAAETIKNFMLTGAIILIEAPTKEDTLEELAVRLGPVREVLFERIHNVKVDPTGYNVAHTALPLPPHNDFASYSWPPNVQALHMLVNETPGGNSIIVDGWNVLTKLRAEHPDMFEVLCRTAVPFREFDQDNETFAVAPIINRNVEGEIIAFRYSNQLMQTVNPTLPGISDFYKAYHELSKRVTDKSTRATFRLEAGQVLVLASHRVLHGREVFEPTGERHLQDAYFEYDNVKNHLFVLNRRIGK